MRKRVIIAAPPTSASKRGKKSTDDPTNDSIPLVKTIADLDDKILLKILEIVIVTSPKSAGFLNASLVCKKWNELISQSDVIVNKLKPEIVLSFTKIVVNTSKFQITRPYQELTLTTKFSP